MNKLLLLVPGVLILAACTPDISEFKSKIPVSRPSLEDREPSSPSEEEPALPSDTETAVVLPDTINLDAPFYPQAPDADWSLPWQEACEEASIALAYHYAVDEPLTKEQFKNDILDLVDWQKQERGDYIHSTVRQTAAMLEGHFGFTDYRIIENPTIEDMKKELAAGRVIVAPFAGRQLGNPFYSGQGPYYHMMVIKGYDGINFITNDVGTKRGENFVYTYETIMSALHDYRENNIDVGDQRIIVLE